MAHTTDNDGRRDKVIFLAYPSEPREIGATIAATSEKVKRRSPAFSLLPWPELSIAGRFIGTTVLESIGAAGAFAADISRLNFNVTYEIGYAIGRGKPLFLVRDAALKHDTNLVKEVGIFDTLGFKEYENSDGLAAILAEVDSVRPLLAVVPANMKAPVYLLETKHKTDWAIRILSRVKKARLGYRSFDPVEQTRLSANEALYQVSASKGILVHFLPNDHADAEVHNQRAAFIAGLAHGMGKVATLLQSGSDPIPLDYRDLVTSFKHPEQIDEAIGEFAAQVAEAMQAGIETPLLAPETLLGRLTLGASTAENEMRDLGGYYLKTDAFQRAVRGEVRLVVGRKGSGKTALFLSVRDAIREDRSNVVLDLKPDGYKLVKFKEAVLDLLSIGTVEHTIMAFWEYLLLLELCHKLLEKDKERHVRDHRLFGPYRRLAEAYSSDRYVAEGDFSERMTRILGEISEDYHSRYAGVKPARLSDPEVTSLLYRHNVPQLLRVVVDYLGLKRSVWLLFDNIDKGWPAHGLKAEDVIIIRALIEATRKLERHLQVKSIESHTLIFLRNDIYELLIDQMPDRGKEPRALLDWTDPDMLRELVRLRAASGLETPDVSFDALWRRVCASHVAGEETSQYLIDRSLMRPRWLLDLIGHARGFAVNLRHDRIEPDDIKKGLAAYSIDLLTDLDHEIRDVLPSGENALYTFIEAPSEMPSAEVERLLLAGGLPSSDIPSIVHALAWYGFLGVLRGPDVVTYIYSPDVNYNMQLFQAICRKIDANGTLRYTVNPAFWPGLSIRPQ